MSQETPPRPARPDTRPSGGGGGIDPRTRSALTLLGLGVVFVFFVGWGFVQLTKPLPATDLGPTSTDICTLRDFAAGDALTPADVAVSVYNASGRSQLARQTMTAFTQNGFFAGNVGDAPEELAVERVEIRAANPESAAVALVRQYVGEPAVVTPDPDVDGVAVYLGAGWDQVRGDAAGTVTVAAPEQVCGPQEAPLP